MVGGNVEAHRAREATSVVSAGRAPAPVLLDGKDLMGIMGLFKRLGHCLAI